MTVYTFDMGDFYIDEDGVSAFTDDNGETVIVADELVEVEGPRVFLVHFVEIVVPLVPLHAMLPDVFIGSDGTQRQAYIAGVMVNL